MNHNIEQSTRQNNPYLYEQAVDILVRSRRKVVVGIQGSKGCATQFSRLLGFLLDRVELLSTGESDEIATLRGLGKGDTVVVINYTRYYKNAKIFAHREFVSQLLQDPSYEHFLKLLKDAIAENFTG